MRVWRDALNACAKLVLNAGVLRFRSCQTDVACQDANAHCLTNCQTRIAHPNKTTLKVNTRQMPLRIKGANVACDQCAGILAHHNRIHHLCQYLVHRTLRFDLPSVQHHHVIGQARHFFSRVRDIQHGYLQRITQTSKPRENFLTARCIQRCQGLVH